MSPFQPKRSEAMMSWHHTKKHIQRSWLSSQLRLCALMWMLWHILPRSHRDIIVLFYSWHTREINRSHYALINHLWFWFKLSEICQNYWVICSNFVPFRGSKICWNDLSTFVNSFSNLFSVRTTELINFDSFNFTSLNTRAGVK